MIIIKEYEGIVSFDGALELIEYRSVRSTIVIMSTLAGSFSCAMSSCSAAVVTEECSAF